MHPIQNRMDAIERHAADVRRAEHRPSWVGDATRRRPVRLGLRRRPRPAAPSAC